MRIARPGPRARMLVASILALTAQAPVSAEPDASSTTGSARLGATLTNMFDAYASAYPEIAFIHLRGPGDIARIDTLISSLGSGASNVDYDHPPEARAALMEAQAQRIRIMLAEGVPSSTLFRTGPGATVPGPYACVITLDMEVLTGDPDAATRFL